MTEFTHHRTLDLASNRRPKVGDATEWERFVPTLWPDPDERREARAAVGRALAGAGPRQEGL